MGRRNKKRLETDQALSSSEGQPKKEEMKRLYWKWWWWRELRREDKIVEYLLGELEKHDIIYIHRYAEQATGAIIKIDDVPHSLHSAPSHSHLEGKERDS